MNPLIDIENKQLIFNGKKLSIILDEENNPWFKGKYICIILGYSYLKQALKTHVNKKYKRNII